MTKSYRIFYFKYWVFFTQSLVSDESELLESEHESSDSSAICRDRSAYSIISYNYELKDN